MKGIWRRIWQLALVLVGTAALGVADTANMPPPGTLNYVEGQVAVQGVKQTPKSVGSTYLEANQELTTRDGNAEMLLTPGIYVRLGHDSELKMISPGLSNTQVQLEAGSALLEVDELFKENNVSVVLDGATTRVEKEGLYDFDANHPSVKVLGGKALATEGDQSVTLKKGGEVLISSTQPMVRKKFSTAQVEEDPLYRWSKLRSEYATESNVNTGNELLAAGGWWGAGWYWDPFWADFAFMPGYGMFWGPFGYPFFSPWSVGFAPYYGFGGAYGGFYHYPVARGKVDRAVPPLARQPVAGSAGFRAFPRSMASSRMGMSPGPFRGGAGELRGSGGFRGGRFAGGFHGGFGGRR